MPLQRRIPKRGFRRLQRNAVRREEFAEINLRSLASFSDGAEVDPGLMGDRGLIAPGRKVKILGDGEFKSKITVRAHAFSKGAREKITALGGVAEVIEDQKRLNA
jgi:large subunit ribosomal protein L15